MALNDNILEISPRTLPFMTLREVVMFPKAIIPLFVGREASIRAIENSLADYNKHIFLITQKDADLENPQVGDLYSVGIVSRILQILHLNDGSIKVLFEGVHRATWRGINENSASPFGNGIVPLMSTVPLLDTPYNKQESEGLIRASHSGLEEFAKLNKRFTQEHKAALSGLQDPSRLADSIMPHLKLTFTQKQEVLEILNPHERLEKAFSYLNSELEMLGLEKTIKSRVKSQMELNQREYYLNEQIKAIQKEMGNEDDPMLEFKEIEEKIKNKNMPEEMREKALRELKKLRTTTSSSGEYTIMRNYIDWILELPWNDLKEIDIDIKKAREILDQRHFGLEKPKERIIEYLAVQKMAKQNEADGLKGPILCLAGPPGVGKTSLAKSIAEATGRDYVRLSLGGVRDEAEIRGHRRTYMGAMPGKVITALKRAASNNPLFCLDEVDKMTADFRGDPAAALLEVLDPEQNSTFVDHYLDADYDLSQIFFITTANDLGNIPAPLRDRMEIINIPSYLETEKVHIAKDFLLQKQISAHGLKESQIKVEDDVFLDIIRYYTRESGVRNLEREIATLCRKAAIELVDSKKTSVKYTTKNLEKALGVQKFRFGTKEDDNKVGIATGLAFNNRGGEILHIETVLMPGTGSISTTGQLGDVMTESAKTAFSYLRSRTADFGLSDDFYKSIDIHVHVPAGATPKDGPSAGITLATSIASALLGIPIKSDLAMTGEITLRGRILPIGGLHEKLLASKRADIKTVLIPKENEKDLTEVPEEITKDLEIHLVEHIDEVLPLALCADKADIYNAESENSLPIFQRLKIGAKDENAEAITQ